MNMPSPFRERLIAFHLLQLGIHPNVDFSIDAIDYDQTELLLNDAFQLLRNALDEETTASLAHGNCEGARGTSYARRIERGRGRQR